MFNGYPTLGSKGRPRQVRTLATGRWTSLKTYPFCITSLANPFSAAFYWLSIYSGKSWVDIALFLVTYQLDLFHALQNNSLRRNPPRTASPSSPAPFLDSIQMQICLATFHLIIQVDVHRASRSDIIGFTRGHPLIPQLSECQGRNCCPTHKEAEWSLETYRRINAALSSSPVCHGLRRCFSVWPPLFRHHLGHSMWCI